MMRGQGRVVSVKKVVSVVQPLSRSAPTFMVLVGVVVFIISFSV